MKETSVWHPNSAPPNAGLWERVKIAAWNGRHDLRQLFRWRQAIGEAYDEGYRDAGGDDR